MLEFPPTAMPGLGRLLVLTAIALVVAACSISPSPTSSPVAQKRTCARLTPSTCDQVIARVESSDPAVRQSRLAMADPALPPSLLAGSSGGDAVNYLVAFAPWGPQPN